MLVKECLKYVFCQNCKSYVRQGRSVTNDIFFTSCELANFLVTRNMTLVGTLRKHKPEIPSLFLSGKQREVFSSWFLSMTFHWYHMYQQERRLSSSSQHSVIITHTWVRKKITNLNSSCTLMPLKVGLTFRTSMWGKTLVWNQQGTGIWNYFQFDWCCLCKCNKRR